MELGKATGRPPGLSNQEWLIEAFKFQNSALYRVRRLSKETAI